MNPNLREHFRGVVWGRDDKGMNRYVIIGMLVTERPLVFGNEHFLDGACELSEAFENIRRVKPVFKGTDSPIVSGDATNVLLTLSDWEI